MRALVLSEVKAPLKLEERPPIHPAEGEVVVSVQAAALNRRDFWITQGLYPGIQPPVVLGSDASGVVSKVGAGVNESWLQQEVIINPGMNWGDSEEFQASDFNILGLPRDGTFSGEVLVPESNLYKKPKHLNWNEAAGLPLAGITAWRAGVTQGRLAKGETVLITGIGGGVATLALQFCVAHGAQVWVTSSSDQKIQKAIDLGAEGGVNYTRENWVQELIQKKVSPQLIIDSAGGNSYASLIDLASPGGRIVNYGATQGPPKKLDLFKVFWKQLTLQGSTMGSPNDFQSMLNFVNEHQLTPVIDQVYSLEEGNEALASMKNSPQFGKLVLVVS